MSTMLEVEMQAQAATPGIAQMMGHRGADHAVIGGWSDRAWHAEGSFRFPLLTSRIRRN